MSKRVIKLSRHGRRVLKNGENLSESKTFGFNFHPSTAGARSNNYKSLTIKNSHRMSFRNNRSETSRNNDKSIGDFCNDGVRSGKIIVDPRMVNQNVRKKRFANL